MFAIIWSWSTSKPRNGIRFMEGELVATLNYGDFKADVYSLTVPGEFKVIYRDGSGNAVEEVPLTGISTYKQREPEIMSRLKELSEGAKPRTNPYLGDSGEY